jgi:hypothetical protein
MDLCIILYDALITKQQYKKTFHPINLTYNNRLFNQNQYQYKFKYQDQNKIKFPIINNKLMNEIKIIEPLDRHVKNNDYSSNGYSNDCSSNVFSFLLLGGILGAGLYTYGYLIKSKVTY